MNDEVENRILGETAVSTRRSYDAAADRYHELFHDELATKPYDRALLERLAATLPPRALVLDAGCGPCVPIGRYLSGRSLRVVGLDIATRCVAIARRHDARTEAVCADMARLPFPDGRFDAVVSYYSILDTPKSRVPVLFGEMARVVRGGGMVMIAVKAGEGEGYVEDLLGVEAWIWFTLFSENEIGVYLEASGLSVELLETRGPYDSEIQNDRIFALARKRQEPGISP